MTEENQQSVIVVGAGIVGVSTAIWLQRLGNKVTLVDREGPGAGTSHGNAGILASIAVVPVPTPGIMKKAPGMLFDPNQPLFVKWSYLPKMIPFLRRYLKNANDSAVNHISSALQELLHDCPDQHLAVAGDSDAKKYISTEDYWFGYDDEAAFAADKYVWKVRKNRGYSYSVRSAEQIAEFDENLRGRFGYGVQCANHGRISDPGAYVKALAAEFEKNGGTISKATITGFDIKDDHCEAIKTTDGVLKADKYIITTGVWTSQWNEQLGISVPMESERGYHVEYYNPSIKLRSPIMVASGKFVVNSMDGRMRCAGVVEFGGLKSNASKAPVELLKKQMAKLFPDLKYDRIEEWMGHRPSTVDSLPVIGVSPKVSNIILGYGHQHIGLSAGPKTGQWLARLASNQPINTDLSAYAADRQPRTGVRK